jgi:hypothetical protein
MTPLCAVVVGVSGRQAVGGNKMLARDRKFQDPVQVTANADIMPWGYAGGTRALKVCGRSCQPLICWTVRIKTRLPAGGTPNLAA